ncbi:MAG TPA: DUF1365 domain-containing protein [Rhizomicrobium sp.]|nr:DUF1365 domain-containing protein [Rhizomicrobium sp.]
MTGGNSAIYEGWVMHRRLAPRHHAFKYRVFCLLLDLDELEGLGRRLRLFAANRAGVVSFQDRDHGDGRPLRTWLDAKLAEAGIVADGPRRVLCYPRLFGYVFNPISTWFCYGKDERLAAIVYEVHNTYGERHSYVLRADGDAALVRQRTPKDFYVSPFLSPDCAYNFKIRPPGGDVRIAIAEEEAGKPILTASFCGTRKALSDRALAGLLLRHPLMTLKVVAAIHFEAVRLMWKGVTRHAHAPAKPAPATIAASGAGD